MKQSLCLFLLACLPFGQVYAQFFYTKGYIVTTANDTLQGEIREADNQAIKFRQSADLPEREYNPSQLSAYSTDGTTRIAGRITEQGKDTTLFMVEQIKGYTSLYRLIKPDGRLTHVLGLPDQTLLPLRGTLALNILTTNLTECPTASFRQRLNPQLFYNSNLYYEQLITRYNDCVKPSATVKQKRKRLGYEVGVLGGVAANNWKYEATEARFNPYWNPNGVFSTYYTFAVGGFYTLAPTKRLSLTIEGYLSQYKGERNVPINDPGNPATRLYYFEEKYLSFPIAARYRFLNKRVKLYAKIGASVHRALTIAGHFNYPTSGPISYPTYSIPIAMRPSGSVGYIVGIGMGVPITPNRTIYAEIRFAPHLVTYGVTRLANARSLQLTVSVPILSQ